MIDSQETNTTLKFRPFVPRYGGFFSYVNVIFLLIGFLTWLLLIRQFSDNYLKATVLGLALLAGVYLIAFMGRIANRIVALTAILLLLLTQIFIDTNRTLGIRTGITRHPAPYVMFTGQPNATYDEDHNLYHNQLGYRGDIPGLPKDDNELRILLIGGSTVYNGALGRSLPEQLEAHLRERGQVFATVYNWGVVSQVSGQEASTIYTRALDFDPDIVIVYGGGNDIISPYSLDPRPGYPFNFMLYERLPNMLQQGDFYAFAAGTLAQVELLNLFFNRELSLNITPIESLRVEVDFFSTEWEAQIIEHYLANLERSCLFAQAGEFQFIAFLQPIVSLKTPLLGEEERFHSTDIAFSDYVVRQYDAARSGFTVLAQQYDTGATCSFIDVSLIYEDADFEAFTDYIHQTDEGRTYTASILAEHVTAILGE